MIAPICRQAVAVASLGTLAFVLGFSEATAQDRMPAVRAVVHRPPAEEKPGTIPKGSVRVVNRDGSTLLSLSLTVGGNDPDIVAQGVPSGTSVVVALPKPGECVYDIEAKFEDWSWVDVPHFDLCQDQTLNVGEGSTDAIPEARVAEVPTPKPPAAKVPAPVPPTSAKTAAAVPAPAASAKAIAARRPAGDENQPAQSRGRIRIENHRGSTLLTLSLAVRGETPHLVAQVLASGASLSVAVPEAGKCVYDVKGEFADNYGTSLPGFDVCKEPTLKFAE